MNFFKFDPVFKQTLWGGERILSYKGISSDRTTIGESWELSALPGSESVVCGGEYAGTTLPELIDRLGPTLVGKHNYDRFGRDFPLLVKFIDARDDLSIQVHPDDKLAQRRYGRNGKTEMWYVIDAEPGASLISGFSRPITMDEYDRRVADDTLSEVLARHSITAGDVFFLPAGRVHSIGRGALIAEIQQPSDVTYRISDFGRVDAAGRPRELHTEQAREAIDFRVESDYRTRYVRRENQEVRLASTPYFSTSLYEVDRPIACDWSPLDSFVCLIFIKGKARLLDRHGSETTLHQGETVLIPALSSQVEMIPEADGATFLACWV